MAGATKTVSRLQWCHSLGDSTLVHIFIEPYRACSGPAQPRQRQFTDLLAKKLVEPSTIPYGAPTLLVEKKTAEYRIAVEPLLTKATVEPVILLSFTMRWSWLWQTG
ncbi:hypothetical protein ABBQ32_008525 [Trebouxia sp. C0010 RCD-2024]